jgi:hypothetical protein
MSRRRSLPGADELFRSTGQPGPVGGLIAGPQAGRTVPAEHHDTPSAGLALAAVADPVVGDGRGGTSLPPRTTVRAPGRRRTRDADRQPSGRERHDEKITVYVSAEELLDLEHARLTLRGDHGLAVDRGRIVREALAVLLADLDAAGESSILVRRLRGR